jgi:FtsH-binding integral membrane protein
MKKTILVAVILSGTFVALAEDSNESLIDRGLVFSVVNIFSIIMVIYLISSFILQLIRQNFDYRLKSKILEKGADENIVSQLVKPEEKDTRNTILQWAFTLAGIALGFTILHFTQPFGLHSLAIMAFCVAAGLGGYYYFTRKNK